MHFLYLHGFASGVDSTKGRYFVERFAELGLTLVALDLNDRRGCPAHVSQQLAAVHAAGGSDTLVLLGSSLGAYVAALYAARNPSRVERLVLLAPAFAFATRWLAQMSADDITRWQEEGLEVDQHAFNRKVRVPFSFISEAQTLPATPDVRCPTLILHGRNDAVVDPRLSESFAATRPHVKLVWFDSDHQLLDVRARLWEEARAFLLLY